MSGLAAALAALLAGPAPAIPADVVITGARVWTAEADHPWAEAVAIREGRLAAVGTRAEVAALQGPKTRVYDLEGRLVTPGLIDAHIHLVSGGLSLEQVDLIEDQTVEAVQARLRAWAAAHPKDPWIVGRGWLYGSFPGGMPTKKQLDAAIPDRPALLRCYDGHSAWANSKALALAKITKATKDPVNGAIVRDPATGEPTGALKEDPAADLVARLIPPPSSARRYELFVEGLRLLNTQGITAVGDAGYLPAELPRERGLFERALREKKLTVRATVSVQMDPGQVAGAVAEARRLSTISRDPRLRFGPVKGYVDGVIEAHTAALLAPYADDPAQGSGTPNWTPEALNAAAVAVGRAGLPLWLHAIGDRGVRMALDAHQAARAAAPGQDLRPRIEHAETIAEADYPRFQSLGVIASMQPLHANPDQNNEKVWSRNLGPDRAGRGFSWGNVERAGGRLAFGSDWPVVTSDVRRGLYCATARKTKEGTPPGGWLPHLAVDLPSALRHYTIDAAYALGVEAEIGSLAVGKRADLAVFSADAFDQPPEALLQARILLTLLDGEVVHADPSLPPARTLPGGTR